MLKTYHTITDLQHFLNKEKQSGRSIGFVPTMGALHNGHISLIEKSKKECSLTVCSIFVNPTQFNDPSDFKKYPRDIEQDKTLLEKNGCDCLFLPDVAEIYPSDDYRKINFDTGYLGKMLEGAYRPGHFVGMVAVVKRLFDIVMPDKAFFGQKDYQQCLIVKKMAEYYHLDLEIITCPTIREKSGLAMSSRNLRLSGENREKAAIIYKTLTWAEKEINRGTLSFEEIKDQARAHFTGNGNFTVDYFDICSCDTLEPLSEKLNNERMVVIAAVWLGDVRLIDNIIVS